MKKFYSLLAAVAMTATIFGQTTRTVTIDVASIGGIAVLKTGNYDNGAERTWSQNGVSYGGKAITGNSANQPTTPTTAGTLIQAQAANGVIYNTTALPGRLVSVTLNQVGTTLRESSLFGGNDSRLVNNTAGNYTTGGTQIGAASTTGWTVPDGTDYTFFAIKRGSSAAYISSITIVYEDPTMAVGDATKAKANLVKNTIVSNELIFGAAAKVSVYNAAGQVVKTAEVTENGRLDVSALPKGNYVVTGVVNGNAVSQKIIKK